MKHFRNTILSKIENFLTRLNNETVFMKQHCHLKDRHLQNKIAKATLALQEPVIIEPVKEQIHSKNKWLYPTDDFGKMEKGVVENSKIYKRVNNTEEFEFTIHDVNTPI